MRPRLVTSARTVACASVAMLGLAGGIALASGQADAWLRSFEYLPRPSARAHEYIRLRYALALAAWCWLLVGLTVSVAMRLGARLAAVGRGGQARWTTRAGLVWLGQTTFVAIWMLPIAVTGLLLERAYGFSTVSLGVWVRDRLLGWFIELSYAPLVVVGIALIRKAPRTWWLWLGCLLVPVGFLLVIVSPAVVDPLFNRFEPLREPALARHIEDLASRSGLRGAHVFVMDASRRTRKANAYVTGLGPTKRIVLFDTLLRNRDEEQTLAVVAHELGHYALRHVWWGFLLQSVGGFVLLWLLAIILRLSVAYKGIHLGITQCGDPAVIPLAHLCLTLLLLLQTPVACAVSRAMERQADAYGLRLYPNPEATARSFAQFAVRDYADPDPPAWVVSLFGTHPPLRQRVAYALSFSRHPALHGR